MRQDHVFFSTYFVILMDKKCPHQLLVYFLVFVSFVSSSYVYQLVEAFVELVDGVDLQLNIDYYCSKRSNQKDSVVTNKNALVLIKKCQFVSIFRKIRTYRLTTCIRKW